MSNNVIELKDVSKSFQGHRVLHKVSFEVVQGEFLTLLGPSGCGKTSLLRLISGFDEPDSGAIMIDGHDVRGIMPQHRHVNTVFQNYALFPHLTVFDNVAFGLRCKGLDKATINEQVNQALQMVKLTHLTARKPCQLSGGQQQRVAIARAVINRPSVLLLDEPLSSLDYRLRKTMQIELKQLQQQLGISFIFVTHDQEEALSMADRVIVMHEGQIEQIGTPREVYEEPSNLQVAQFIGEANVFTTELLSFDQDQYLQVKIEGIHFSLKNRRGISTRQPLYTLVRPEDMRIWTTSEVTDSRQMLPGVVIQVIYKGSTVDLIIRVNSGTLLAATQFFDADDETLDFYIGEPVWVDWIPGWEILLSNEN